MGTVVLPSRGLARPDSVVREAYVTMRHSPDADSMLRVLEGAKDWGSAAKANAGLVATSVLAGQAGHGPEPYHGMAVADPAGPGGRALNPAATQANPPGSPETCAPVREVTAGDRRHGHAQD